MYLSLSIQKTTSKLASKGAHNRVGEIVFTYIIKKLVKII